MNATFSNYTNNSINSSCRVAQKILETPNLSVLLGLDFLVGGLAIVLNFFFFCATWKVSLFHVNLRLLLSHMALCGIVFSVSCMTKASTLLSVIAKRSDPCVLVLDSYTCKIKEIPSSWTSQLLMYASASITLERLYCTLSYKKPYKGFPWLGIALLFFSYVIPVQNFLRNLSIGTGYVPVCENLLSTTSDSAKVSLSINLTFTFISLFLAGILHYLNQSRLRSMLANRAKTHTLVARFQIDQNVQLNQIIIPSAILEFVTFSPSYLFLLLIVAGFQISYETKTILIHCNYLWKACFSLAYPSLAFARNVHLRRGLIKAIPVSIRKYCCDDDAGTSITKTRVTVITPKGLNMKSEARTHFELLDKTWNRPVKPIWGR